MPKYATPNPGPEDGMYDDAGPSGSQQQEPDKPEEKDDHKTYLLPLAVAEGKEFEPGDEIVLRIEAIHDDQYEVSYAPAKEQEKKDGEEPMGQEAEAGNPGGKGGMGSLYE